MLTRVVDPLRTAAALWLAPSNDTERPDAMLWRLAPAVYAACAAAALCVLPLWGTVAIADVEMGIVFFGAVEALAIVSVFLMGWSPNAHLSLVAGYRFVALALSYELLSMFVLIATALPAESLRVGAIVASQMECWNVIRQPVGLPIWIVVTWGVSFWGPLDVVEGRDLATGSSSELSGRALLWWQVARRGMLAVFCAMGATAFLGGPLGPWLPGPLWMLLKTGTLLALVVWLGARWGRMHVERLVPALWTRWLPLSFAGLVLAGFEALW